MARVRHIGYFPEAQGCPLPVDPSQGWATCADLDEAVAAVWRVKTWAFQTVGVDVTVEEYTGCPLATERDLICDPNEQAASGKKSGIGGEANWLWTLNLFAGETTRPIATDGESYWLPMILATFDGIVGLDVGFVTRPALLTWRFDLVDDRSEAVIVSPASYWPYALDDGTEPIYDTTTGERLRVA